MTAPAVEIRRAGPDDAETFANLCEAAMAGHAGRRWTARDFAEILSESRAIGLLAVARDAAGYALIRPAADEAELLSIAVVEARRGQGIARALLTEGARLAEVAGAGTLFLEVAEDNLPALRLYRAAGFAEIARRADYYGGDGEKKSVGAIVMNAALPLGPARAA